MENLVGLKINPKPNFLPQFSFHGWRERIVGSDSKAGDDGYWLSCVAVGSGSWWQRHNKEEVVADGG